MKKLLYFGIFHCLIYSHNTYAIDISSFDANVYSDPDIYELKSNNPFIAYGVMAFREDYKAHMWHVSNKENYLVNWMRLKYRESVYGVLPNEIAKCLFNINEYKNNNTDILTCVGNIDNYTVSNFVYYILINFLNQAINGNKEIDEKLVDSVVTELNKKHENNYSDKLKSASYSLKQYCNQLHLYDYLLWLRNAKKEYQNTAKIDNFVKKFHYVSNVKFITKITNTKISKDILNDEDLVMNFVMKYNKEDTDVFKIFPRDNLNKEAQKMNRDHLLKINKEFFCKPNIREMILTKTNKNIIDDVYEIFKVQNKRYGFSEDLLKTIYAITVAPRLNTSHRHCRSLLSLYLYNDCGTDFEDSTIAKEFFNFIENNQCYIDISKNVSEYKDINIALYLLDQLTNPFQDKIESVPNPNNKKLLSEIVSKLNERLFGKASSNKMPEFLSHMLTYAKYSFHRIPEEITDSGTLEKVEYMDERVLTEKFCELIEKKRIVDLHCLIENGYGSDCLTQSEQDIIDMVFAIVNVPRIRKILDLCDIDRLFGESIIKSKTTASIVYSIYECLNSTNPIFADQLVCIGKEQAKKITQECMMKRGKYIKKLVKRLTDQVGAHVTISNFIDKMINKSFVQYIAENSGVIDLWNNYDSDKELKQLKDKAYESYKKFTEK